LPREIILALLQEEANATQILGLRKVRNIAAQKTQASKKQKKMTDYFKI
jgi:hypothetical protein